MARVFWLEWLRFELYDDIALQAGVIEKQIDEKLISGNGKAELDLACERVPRLRYAFRTRSTDNSQFHSKGLGLLLCPIVTALPAVAGGSWERLRINEIAISGVNYTLVVSRIASASIDPYFRGCKRFEVRGTYRWLKGSLFHQETGLSRDDHIRALEFLRHAFEIKQQVESGWIGVGFEPIESAKPCGVSSRALQLLQDEQGIHVLSYHTSTSARSD